MVVGVGHEVDVTIADFSADYRAPTPSAAAEVLSDDRAELMAQLAGQRRALEVALRRRLQRERLHLTALASRLRHPGDRLRDQAQRLDDLESRLVRAMRHRLSRARDQEQGLASRLAACSPRARIVREGERLDRAGTALATTIRRRLDTERKRLRGQTQLLESLSPLAVLQRGYAIIRRDDDTVLRDAADVAAGDALHARLARGSLKLRVTARDDDGS